MYGNENPRCNGGFLTFKVVYTRRVYLSPSSHLQMEYEITWVSTVPSRVSKSFSIYAHPPPPHICELRQIYYSIAWANMEYFGRKMLASKVTNIATS